MDDDGERVNRIVRGNARRRVLGAAARERIQRELHGIVVRTPTPTQHADWWYDLRRKRLQAWGGMLRFIDVSAMQGVSREALLKIPDVINA